MKLTSSLFLTALNQLPKAWTACQHGSSVFWPRYAQDGSPVYSSTIPEQWRVAQIRPVAKTKTPAGPGDFRPISVVPVLWRVLERIVVSRYIYPALAEPPINKLIQDQFAFRPTGSTSAALIDLLQKTTDLLRVNEFVAIISVDFTKAFDRIRHHALSQKYL